MPLNKVTRTGNMYQFVNMTFNTVKGACYHNCDYCFMKKWGPQKPVRFDEKEMNTDLGSGNFIFIGSSCDLFSKAIKPEWIKKTMEHCRKYLENRYLFQSKDPARMFWAHNILPPNSVCGTTIETNRIYPEMGKTPTPLNRALHLNGLNEKFETMLTIEPIMDFDIDELVDLVHHAKPSWVNIGANTRTDIKLPEPSAEKIGILVERLKKFFEIKFKDNLKRLYRR